MSLHCARTSRRLGLTALALLALTPSVAFSQATDGSISTLAQIADPADVAYAGDTLLVADRASNFIRAVAPDGTVTTAAGTGDPADNCNDGNDDLLRPRGVTSGAPGGGFLVTSGNCIMRVEPDGDVFRFAGAQDGGAGLSGDGGSARAARLRGPADTTVAPDGTVYITDTLNHRVRRVTPDGSITTVPTGELSLPRDVAVAADGSLLIADLGNHRVRRVATDGTVTTVAGGAGQGFSGDGDPATTAQLNAPVGLVALPNNGFLVADGNNDRVRRVTPLGAIFTVAGGGAGGDGGLAKDADLTRPEGITARPGGGFVIADTSANRVRAVTDVGAVPGATDGRSFNVFPALGAVTVRPSGQPAYLPLAEEDLVPLGSQVDARDGELDIAVRRAAGNLEPARVLDGRFKPVALADDVTSLNLTEPLGCGNRRRFGGASCQKTPKPKRRLWAKSKGKYRIKGRYVGALERGTFWRVTETCNRSTVKVLEGSVLVVDRTDGSRHIVRAPRSFTVRAGSARRGRARPSARARAGRRRPPAPPAARG